MFKKLVLTIFLVLVQTAVFSATISSTTTGGLWSSGSSWVGGVSPISTDDVVISSGSTVTVNADAFAKSINVSGTLTINHGKILTVYGNVDVVSGAQFNAGTGNSDSAIIKVYGNFTNNGTANFWKSTVVIAGDLVTGSTILQNNGEIIVGGNVSAVISGGGNGYVYPVNPNATVSVTGTSNAQVAGTIPTDSALLSLMYEVIYGGTCPFVGNTANVSACLGTNVTFSVTFSSFPTTGTPTYQWEVNMNNGSGWVSTGVTTATLTTTGVTISMNSYKYRAKITWNGCTKSGNYGVLTVNATNTWTGTTNTNWFTATNWSCGSVPILSTDVIIPNVTNKPIIDDTTSITAFANTLTIEIGSSLTIKSDNTLKITDKLTNNGGTIIFEDSASLVQTNNVVNTGNITYEKTTSVFHTDYTYWSSPVAPQTLYNLSPNTLAGKFYSYNAATENWIQESSANNMIAGKGYIIRGPETTIFLAPFTASFFGVPNNGNISITIPGGTTSNLIGNPYPSAIDADLFLDANNTVIEGTLYFWTHNTGMVNGKYADNDYASYNLTGGVLTAPSVNSGYNNSTPSGKIAASQGFFATSTLAGGTATFTNAMRLVGTTLPDGTGINQQFFKSRNPKTTKAIEKNRVWLNLTNTQGAFKQTLIGYITGATNDYDDRFDGESFDGNEFVDFYSVNQDKNLVIQGRALPFDENDEVPLGYRTTINGAFTINIDQVDGSLTNQAVFIEDKLTNTVTDLKSGNYTFNTVAGTFNDRFVLRYTNTSKTLAAETFDSLENKVLVSNKNKQIKINSFTETIDKVTIYDLLGRQIYQKNKVNNNELSIVNLVSSRQTLIVETVLQNGATVTDKIIY